MNAVSSNSKWLAVGLGILGIVACSAEASEPAKPGGNGTSGTSTTGGSGNSTAGTLPTGTAGTTPTGTAGTAPSGTAGTAPTGTAGTAPTGTAGTAGSGAGGMDGGALTVCPSPPAAGTIADLLIDDLEDGDNGLSKVGGRSGYWYTYMDPNGTTITPAPDASKTNPLKPGTTNCHGGSTSCIIISGTTVANDLTVVGMEKYGYAGVGFDFSNAMKSCVYNGSAYTGIKFWARGDVAVTVKLNTPAIVPTMDGGTCEAMCTDGFSPTGADVLLDTEWTQIDLPFATAMQAGWGAPVTLDKAQLFSLQIQIPPGQTFNVALDDFTFY